MKCNCQCHIHTGAVSCKVCHRWHYLKPLKDARQQARKTSESSNRTDESGVRNSSPANAMQVEQAGSKSVIDFPGRMYDRDWVSQEND